ncbi:tRNA-Val4 [Bacillus sp. L381]|uniref:tRNA-Val4 n=1 Tax=Bacillus TaxID=1386 RepID=UPI00215CC4C3|nr:MULTISPECIES: tRNA-Val4 [Bacillus]WIX22789.1 tRNA-Val4 [Bacillus sp. L381]
MLEYFSDFIEDIVSVSEANEYLKLIQKVLDGSIEEYEIQLNTAIAYIKEDQTVIEYLYTKSENDTRLRDKIPQRYKSDN